MISQFNSLPTTHWRPIIQCKKLWGTQTIAINYKSLFWLVVLARSGGAVSGDGCLAGRVMKWRKVPRGTLRWDPGTTERTWANLNLFLSMLRIKPRISHMLSEVLSPWVMYLLWFCWLTWRPEDNLQESVFSLHHVGPRDGTQVDRLGDTVSTFILSDKSSHGP